MAHEKILFLGPEDSPLITWLREQGEQVIQTADKLSAENIAEQGYSFLVSYGYRHILRNDILDFFPGRAIRSGLVCLNNFPRFISGFRAGYERRLGAHHGLHPTRPGRSKWGQSRMALT